MNIEWGRVTWYSQIIAVVLFVGVFVLGYYLGGQTQKQKDMQANAVGVQSAPVVKPIAVATFKCDAGKEVQASFYQNDVKLDLSDGRSMTLPHAMSADGARYANTDESVVFWNVGKTANMTEGSSTTFANCTQIAAPVNQ